MKCHSPETDALTPCAVETFRQRLCNALSLFSDASERSDSVFIKRRRKYSNGLAIWDLTVFLVISTPFVRVFALNLDVPPPQDTDIKLKLRVRNTIYIRTIGFHVQQIL